MSEIDQDQDCYREGLFARALGRSCACNPYPEHSRAAWLWIHGWWMVDPDTPRGRVEPEAVSLASELVDLADAIRNAPTETARRSGFLRAISKGVSAKGSRLAGAALSLCYCILRLFVH